MAAAVGGLSGGHRANRGSSRCGSHHCGGGRGRGRRGSGPGHVDCGSGDPGPQAEAAAQENSRRAEALLAALKQALGPGDQVKTLGYHLSPVYAPQVKNGPLEIKGYQAVNRLQVKLQGTARLGAVIDLALKNGASAINGPFWGYAHAEELQRQAAVAALERARRLAEALAQSQGLKIKGVEKISTGIRILPLGGPERAMRLAAAAPVTPIEVGAEEIKASVQAVFLVEP